eukprot:scaffold7679_cov96-Skeletonema_marinoi.AAC.5
MLETAGSWWLVVATRHVFMHGRGSCAYFGEVIIPIPTYVQVVRAKLSQLTSSPLGASLFHRGWPQLPILVISPYLLQKIGGIACHF